MTIKNVHWGYSALVPAMTNVELTGSGMTWGTQTWPYTVPAGYWLAIAVMSMDSKLAEQTANYLRNNFFTIDNVKSLPTVPGHAEFTPPIVIPPGVVLHARFINNSNEAQWMNSQVTGWLVPQSVAPTQYDVWEQVR